MTGKSQPTEGDWQFYRHRHHQVISDTGASVCTVHKGNRHNGPVLAAAVDSVVAVSMLLDAVEKLRRGDAVPGLDERIKHGEAAISKAKGETE